MAARVADAGGRDAGDRAERRLDDVCLRFEKELASPAAVKKIVGDIMGNVTFHRIRQPLAPSVLAASTSSCGTAWSPASMMTKVKPIVCHQSMPMIAGIVHVGSLNQSGASKPSF